MIDLIDRQAASYALNTIRVGKDETWYSFYQKVLDVFSKLPSAQPEGWMERNKDRILQAGKEGREVEFRIGGRLFAIREKAQ